MSDFILRNARIQDAPGMALVESQCWPLELASSEKQIRARIHTFPAGQWVAQWNEQIVGVAFAQRITQSFLDQTPKQYGDLTDHGALTSSHQTDGEIYQLVSVGVSAACQGSGLGRRLVDRQLQFARSLASIVRIIGFTRPDHYQDHADLAIDQYVRRRRADGRLVDPTIAFHVDAGAKIISTHENYRPKDAAARGYGVMVEYS